MTNTRKIKAKMAEMGIQQTELSKRTSIGYTQLNLKINGKRKFNASEMNKISKELKIETGERMTYFFV